MKIALTIPWFGKALKGGAEQQAWQIATRLIERGVNVDVLTSCSESFLSDWSKNHYESGDYTEEGVTVKRFGVQKRDKENFDLIVGKLLAIEKEKLIAGVSPLTPREEESFLSNSIYAPKLQEYIEKHIDTYDFFLFLPYLFPNIIHGVKAAGKKAVLQPCLHDEAYAYLHCVHENFLEAGALFFNSRGEYETALKLYGPSIIPRSTIVYEGVEVDIRAEVHYERYLLCLGRRDEGKNTDLLIKSFDTFIEETGSDLRLLIAGPGTLPVQAKSDNIVDLGLISEEEKEKLLSHCLALVNPSEHESFSRVIFESWYAKKPVLVHRECSATYYALQDAGDAGFYAGTTKEWVTLLKEIDKLPIDTLRRKGETGLSYAKRVADWDAVMDRYIDTFEKIIAGNRIDTPKAKMRSIHQLLPNLAYGDAISNQARMIRQMLISEGYDSRIFAHTVDPRVESECTVLGEEKPNEEDVLIYHHSIGFESMDFVIGYPGKKALIYHNITPKDFFEKYDPKTALALDEGRRHLKELSSIFDLNFGDSQFNCDELHLYGFKDPCLLPLPISPEKWNYLPDSRTITLLRDGKKNILFTGRISPHKKQSDLIEMMRYLKRINAETRLILVGGGKDEADLYYNELRTLIRTYHLDDDIVITNQVSEAELKSYFMVSDLFVSMSEHEGLGVPLIEAMWFDIPVLSYRSTAVPETLSNGGIMFVHKKEMLSIAALANLMLTNDIIRKSIIEGQREAREKFSFSAVKNSYFTMFKELDNA